MTLDFIQIIYEEYQREHCYPFATVYKNEVCTPFFENYVIADLVPASNAEYISVVSWRLKQKRGDMFRLVDKTLSIDRIMEQSFDVAILTPRGHKDILTKIYHWHPVDATRSAIEEFENFIHFPETVKHAIYENHFIARADIYKEYVNDCLIPAIEFMKERPVFLKGSGYITRKRGAELEHAVKLLSLWGLKDYPMAPFILERLFSIWIDKKDVKIINL
jgi:hypothetical protein